MKKLFSLFLILTIIFSITACSKSDKTDDLTGNTNSDKGESVDNYDGEQVSCFGATVVEIGENVIVVEPDAESNEAKSADRISASLNNISVDAKIGDRVAIMYEGGIAETYPAQINDVISIEVIYDWGITLTAKNISLSGLTLVCTQSGGEITGEINAGDDYFLEVMTDNGWEKVPTVIEEYAWNSIAYIVTLGGTTAWDIDWNWLYGELGIGTYRLGKNFMDFRTTGDYDNAVFYAEFVITDDTVQTSSDLVICD